MNASDSSTSNRNPQTYPSPAREDPLREAVIANASLKLHLRRLRCNLVGAQKIGVINRLLDVNAAVALALEWLSGKADATNEGLERLAMESHAMPGAVGAVAQ